MNQNSYFWGGPFYKTFWFEASLYMFLIFKKFKRSFFSFIFVFWKFWNYILNQNSHFRGSVLSNFLIWGLFIYFFWFFGNLGGLIWFRFLVFENFEIVLWIRIPSFGRVCFIKLFDLRPPYICFFISWKIRVFLVWFLDFWKFWNCILNQNSHFWGVCFIKLLNLRPPYICF